MANKSTATKARKSTAARTTKVEMPAPSTSGQLSPTVRAAARATRSVTPEAEALARLEASKSKSTGKNAHPTTEAPAGAVFVETKIIPLDEIVIAKGNPRREFDNKKLELLGRSMVEDGQAEACGVRELPNGEGYELFHGERRWRASKLVKMAGLRCDVFRVTAVALNTMRGAENFYREDFNPIEEAVWFQQQLDGGMTQTRLADKLGVSQGEVSNTVRLLQLPENWQAEVMSRKISTTDARAILPYLEAPGLADAVLKEVLSQTNRGRRADVKNIVSWRSREISRPLKDDFWSHPKTHHSEKVDLKPTEAELKELNVHTINGQRRAFNIPLWEKLQKASVAKRKEAEAKRASKSGKGTSGKVDGIMSEAEKERHYQNRLWKYSIEWKHCQILDQIDTQPLVLILRLMLHFATSDGIADRDRRLESLVEDTGLAPKRKDDWESVDLWPAMKKLAPGEIEGFVRKTVAAWCATGPWGYHTDMNPEMINHLADELQVNIATDWRVDEGFLRMHTTGQLEVLCSEWKLEVARKNPKKSELIAAILEVDANLPLPTPKCLMSVKEP